MAPFAGNSPTRPMTKKLKKHTETFNAPSAAGCLAVANWTRVATNAFAADGTFAITNAITAGTPKQFFVLQLQ